MTLLHLVITMLLGASLTVTNVNYAIHTDRQLGGWLAIIGAIAGAVAMMFSIAGMIIGIG